VIIHLNNMKIDSLKNIFHKKPKKAKLVKGVNPQHDWMVTLRIYLFVGIVLILFSLYFLNKLKNDEFFNSNGSGNTSPATIDQKMLDTILSSFQNKANMVNDIKLGDKVFVDPSR